jgi:hypothetical protein
MAYAGTPVAPVLLIFRSVEPRRAFLLGAFLALWAGCSPLALAQQATFLYPPNGAVKVDPTKPFAWTSVSGAQAYRLSVGTTSGGKDVIDTGQIQQTSRAMGGVPPGRPLYARIWTELDGTSLYSEINFMVGVPSPLLVATFVYPTNGAVDVDATKVFEWTSASGAQAYRLHVGTTSGGKDVIDTGQIQQTSRAMVGVPPGRTLYARIWTERDGAWLYSEINFTAVATPVLPVTTGRPHVQAVGLRPGPARPLNRAAMPAPAPATFVYPGNGAVNVDPTQPFAWTSVADAQAYSLYVGTSWGTYDLINSGEISQTTYSMVGLPSGQTLYALIWTKLNGAWLYSGISFTASASVATLIYPFQGATSVDLAVLFQWTPVAAAQAYSLDVGSGPANGNVISTGPIQATSYPVSGLPAGVTLYARLWTEVAGQWLSVDSVFTTRSLAPPLPITIVYPQAGVGMDAGLPFQWSISVLADAWRLEIGRQPGGHDLDDSGEIRVTRRFVTGLPQGIGLFGRVSARVGGSWGSVDFSFGVTSETASLARRIDSALWATDFVRQMAGPNNIPFPSTELYLVTHGGGAACTDYSQALLNILVAMNTGLPSRFLNVCMNPNFYDCHTLVQLSADGGLTWIPLDPTFDITMKRASDGNWAQPQDVSTATRTFAWSAINYVYLGPQTDAFLKGYYIDYPLLYLNTYEGGAPIIPGTGLSPLPYYQEVTFPVQNQPAIYVLRSQSLPHVEVSIDGLDTDVPFDGSDFLTHAFYAGSVSPGPGVDPATLRAYVPRRFEF